MPRLKGAFVFIFFLGFFSFGISQKLVEKSIINPETRSVQIDGTRCFQLVLDTHESDLLKVEASMEGEYAKDLVIIIEEDGKNIGISAGFLPSFKNPNDKLSAHKVISILLHVTLPEYMTTLVHGTRTNVTAQGKYKSLTISLSDGNCTLHKVSEKTMVKTQSGEILVSSARGTVSAESTYGKVQKGYIPSGEETYTLRSIEGTIIVNGNNG